MGAESGSVVISALRGSGCFCCCRPWRSAGRSVRRGLQMQVIIALWVLRHRNCLSFCRLVPWVR